jgi:carbon monoxide dehydrogenase subunit G
MASIRRSIVIDRTPDAVWDALRDVGALHTRLVVGFVTHCSLQDGARDVTFANGMKVRELIVDIDDRERRVAWTAQGERLTHHNASAQVRAAPDGKSEVQWIADLLPDEMAPAISGMIEQGLDAMKRTLEGQQSFVRPGSGNRGQAGIGFEAP